MKKSVLTLMAGVLLACSVVPALAMDNHAMEATAQKSYQVKGEVVSVDLPGSRVQLKHAAVPELKWPAMTMYFAVADKAQLNGLKAGEKVEVAFVPQKGSAPLIKQINRSK